MNTCNFLVVYSCVLFPSHSQIKSGSGLGTGLVWNWLFLLNPVSCIVVFWHQRCSQQSINHCQPLPTNAKHLELTTLWEVLLINFAVVIKTGAYIHGSYFQWVPIIPMWSPYPFLAMRYLIWLHKNTRCMLWPLFMVNFLWAWSGPILTTYTLHIIKSSWHSLKVYKVFMQHVFTCTSTTYMYNNNWSEHERTPH